MKYPFLMLIAVLLLAACAPGNADPEITPPPQAEGTLPIGNDPDATQIPETAGGGILENTRWQLESFGAPEEETPPVQGSTITLEFGEENMVGGSAGCNTYGGSYTVDDVGIQFRDIASTLIACDDQQVNEQESRYLQMLQTARQYTIEQDRLILAEEGGAPLMSFLRAVP